MVEVIRGSHRGVAGGFRGGGIMSVLGAGVSEGCGALGCRCAREEIVEAEWLASWAASALVTARLSSPKRTRLRTSRARLLRDLVGGGGLRGYGTDSGENGTRELLTQEQEHIGGRRQANILTRWSLYDVHILTVAFLRGTTPGSPRRGLAITPNVLFPICTASPNWAGAFAANRIRFGSCN